MDETTNTPETTEATEAPGLSELLLEVDDADAIEEIPEEAPEVPAEEDSEEAEPDTDEADEADEEDDEDTEEDEEESEEDKDEEDKPDKPLSKNAKRKLKQKAELDAAKQTAEQAAKAADEAREGWSQTQQLVRERDVEIAHLNNIIDAFAVAGHSLPENAIENLALKRQLLEAQASTSKQTEVKQTQEGARRAAMEARRDQTARTVIDTARQYKVNPKYLAVEISALAQKGEFTDVSQIEQVAKMMAGKNKVQGKTLRSPKKAPAVTKPKAVVPMSGSNEWDPDNFIKDVMANPEI